MKLFLQGNHNLENNNSTLLLFERKIKILDYLQEKQLKANKKSKAQRIIIEN